MKLFFLLLIITEPVVSQLTPIFKSGEIDGFRSMPLSDQLTNCGTYFTIQINLQCALPISGDYMFLKMNTVGTKAYFLKLPSIQQVQDHQVLLIQSSVTWEIEVDGIIVAMVDEGCPNDKNTWTVKCFNGTMYQTVEKIQNSYDPYITVTPYSQPPSPDICREQYDAYELEILDKLGVTDENCTTEVEGLYTYKGGVFGGARMYEKASSLLSLYHNPYFQTTTVGYIMHIGFDKAASLSQSMKPTCPNEIDKLVLLCDDDIINVDCNITHIEPVQGNIPYLDLSMAGDESAHDYLDTKENVKGDTRDRKLGQTYQSSHIMLNATFVFNGTYCVSNYQKKDLKMSLKNWDQVIPGSCIEDGSCVISNYQCDFHITKEQFIMIVTFEELYNKSHKISPDLLTLEKVITKLPKDIKIPVAYIGKRKSSILTFRLYSTETELKPRCLSGSEAVNRSLILCAWCSVGHYEQEGKCIKCPAFTYQDEVGEISCKSCDSGGILDSETESDTGQTKCKYDPSYMEETELTKTDIAVIITVSVLLMLFLLGAFVGYFIINKMKVKVVVNKIQSLTMDKPPTVVTDYSNGQSS